jgi:hypothetical protein
MLSILDFELRHRFARRRLTGTMATFRYLQLYGAPWATPRMNPNDQRHIPSRLSLPRKIKKVSFPVNFPPPHPYYTPEENCLPSLPRPAVLPARSRSLKSNACPRARWQGSRDHRSAKR